MVNEADITSAREEASVVAAHCECGVVVEGPVLFVVVQQISAHNEVEANFSSLADRPTDVLCHRAYSTPEHGLSTVAPIRASKVY